MLKIKRLSWEEHWDLYRFSFFFLSTGVSSLRDRKCLYHYLPLWWKCLQMYDYQDPILKTSWNWPVIKSSNLKLTCNPLNFYSENSNFLCLHFDPLELWIDEKKPPQFPLEVERAFFSFRFLIHHQEPWEKPIF